MSDDTKKHFRTSKKRRVRSRKRGSNGLSTKVDDDVKCVDMKSATNATNATRRRRRRMSDSQERNREENHNQVSTFSQVGDTNLHGVNVNEETGKRRYNNGVPETEVSSTGFEVDVIKLGEYPFKTQLTVEIIQDISKVLKRGYRPQKIHKLVGVPSTKFNSWVVKGTEFNRLVYDDNPQIRETANPEDEIYGILVQVLEQCPEFYEERQIQLLNQEDNAYWKKQESILGSINKREWSKMYVKAEVDKGQLNPDESFL